MQMRLIKTFLSKKPSLASTVLGLLSFQLLILVFWWQPDITANGHLIYSEGEYWRAFTTSLMHADLNHLGSNALFFTIFAILLNGYFGWLIFPVLSLLAGGLTNLIVLRIYPEHIFLVGISGVIYFMAAFWMTLYVCIDRKLKPGRRLMNALAVSLILLFPEVFQERVSYLAHGVGFALGVPLALMYFFFHKKRIRGEEVWEEVPPVVHWEWLEDEGVYVQRSFQETESPHSEHP